MPRPFVLLLAVSMLAVLTACAGADSPTTSAGDTEGSSFEDTRADSGIGVQDTAVGEDTARDSTIADVSEDTAPDTPEDTEEDTDPPDIKGDTTAEDTAPDTMADVEEDRGPDVVANMPPEAVVGEPLVGFAGLPVVLDGTGSFDNDGEIVEHRWSLGEGEQLGAVVEYTWNQPGTWAASLRVTDDQGAFATLDFEVTIRDPAEGAPTAAITLPEGLIRTDEEALFDSAMSSDPDGELVAWSWRLEGAGEPVVAEGEQWSWTFAEPGMYTLSLTVTDNDGLTDVTEEELRIGALPEAVATASDPPLIVDTLIVFDGSMSTDEDGSVVQWMWDFGDGAQADGDVVEHTYTAEDLYRVTLTVTDDDGLMHTAQLQVSVGTDANVPPMADAGPDVFGDIGATIRFNGGASMDPDGTIVQWTWDFGDGEQGEGDSPVHIYDEAGAYAVTLTVTDDDGAEGTDTLVAMVASANEAPIADAGGAQTANVNEAVMFDGSGSADLDGVIVQWAWDFGDGQFAGTETTSHVYTSPGVYTVTLTVTDDLGAEGSDTAEITVIQPNRPPVASFMASPNPAGIGEVVTLNANASSDPDGDTIAIYAWDFGDGSPQDIGPLVAHTFAAEGVYTVTLTVTDPLGEIGQSAQLVTVECLDNCYDGVWEILPFDTNVIQEASCGDYDVEVGPSTCITTVTGSNIVFDCGADGAYRGTLTGSSFTVNFDLNLIFDPLCGGNVWFQERIEGTFLSNSRWEGTSYLSVLTDTFCFGCTFDPFQKTGNKLE